MFLIVWLTVSHLPFACGLYGVIVICLEPYCSSIKDDHDEVNSPPLSLIIFKGAPCLQNNMYSFSAISLAFLVHKGNASV
jgi:hypothetical protein